MTFFSCPKAGRTLPFPIDEKKAKISSKQTHIRRFDGLPTLLKLPNQYSFFAEEKK